MDALADVSTDAAAVVGRERELGRVRAFVQEEGRPLRALLISGEPGIGKTTLWEYGVATAERGVNLLRARPAGAEASLSLSGLTDLLAPSADALLSDLPAPQRRALESALLWAPVDDAIDPRALSSAVLTALGALARSGGVLIAIDDVQWLDEASAGVLRYALRRLGEEPVALLVASRSTHPIPDPLTLAESLRASSVDSLVVGPMGIDDLAKLVRSRLALSLPRPALSQILATSGGNPFYALEIARGLGGGGLPPAGQPLSLPRSLTEAVQARLATLGDAALEILIVAAALARPTVSVVADVVGDDATVQTGLVDAERADVVRIEGDRVLFTHPLLASTIYGTAPALQRRALHRRLGAVLTDPEERAVHQAMGATKPSRPVAESLEIAAESARRRGAVDAAGRLLERAVGLVPPQHSKTRRRLLLAAASASAHAGAVRRAQDLVREAVALSAPGTERAEALYELAESLYSTDGIRAAMPVHREALAEPGLDPDVAAKIHRELSWYAVYAGMPSEAAAHARQGVALAEAGGDPVQVMKALDAASHVAFCLDLDDYGSLMARALELERHHRSDVYPDEWPSTTEGQHMLYRDELDAARARFTELADAAIRAGDEAGRCTPFYHLALVEFAAGDWALARRYADEAYEILFQAERTAEVGSKLFARALVEAHLGLVDEARRSVEAGMAAATSGAAHAHARLLGVLGFVELSLGDLRAAADHLRAASRESEPLQFNEPGFFRFGPDYVETLVGLGELDEAQRLTSWLAERGERSGRRWAIATAARGQALIHAARGEIDEALREAARSVRLLEDFGQPFELARSLLVRGVIQRRVKQRRHARQSLTAALALFARLGASLWAAKAEAALARIGGRTASGDELTDTERQVAEQVALGLRNREVAERLYISVRTVEANLSRAYAKLGVRSRAELAGRLNRN